MQATDPILEIIFTPKHEIAYQPMIFINDHLHADGAIPGAPVQFTNNNTSTTTWSWDTSPFEKGDTHFQLGPAGTEPTRLTLKIAPGVLGTYSFTVTNGNVSKVGKLKVIAVKTTPLKDEITLKVSIVALQSPGCAYMPRFVGNNPPNPVNGMREEEGLEVFNYTQATLEVKLTTSFHRLHHKIEVGESHVFHPSRGNWTLSADDGSSGTEIDVGQIIVLGSGPDTDC